MQHRHRDCGTLARSLTRNRAPAHYQQYQCHFPRRQRPLRATVASRLPLGPHLAKPTSKGSSVRSIIQAHTPLVYPCTYARRRASLPGQEHLARKFFPPARARGGLADFPPLHPSPPPLARKDLARELRALEEPFPARKRRKCPSSPARNEPSPTQCKPSTATSHYRTAMDLRFKCGTRRAGIECSEAELATTVVCPCVLELGN